MGWIARNRMGMVEWSILLPPWKKHWNRLVPWTSAEDKIWRSRCTYAYGTSNPLWVTESFQLRARASSSSSLQSPAVHHPVRSSVGLLFCRVASKYYSPVLAAYLICFVSNLTADNSQVWTIFSKEWAVAVMLHSSDNFQWDGIE